MDYTYFDSQNHSADVGADDDLVQVKLSGAANRRQPGHGGRLDRALLAVPLRLERTAEEHLRPGRRSPASIADRADISDADDILAKGDDDDNSGQEDYAIQDYASTQYTYYTIDVKTDNSGAGTEQDPKCVTVWAPSGENLQSKYGGSDVDEVDSGTGKYLVKSETTGGCASCGGRRRERHARVLLPAAVPRHARQQ